MKVNVETNRTYREPEHRLELTTKEIRDYVFPRFKYVPKRGHKKVVWRHKPGLTLDYRTVNDQVVVGFTENGYGVPNKFYTLNELEELMMPF